MEDKIVLAIKDAVSAVEQLASCENKKFIANVAEAISSAYQNGNKIIIAGNGGSLCDATHFAEELTGQFRQPRKALEAVALSDPGFLTCCANDFGFENVFARGVQAHGKSGDLFIGLTTSGKSPNLIKAFEMAKRMGLITVAFLGKGGGPLRGFCDYEMIIEGFKTSDRIQEAHMSAIHIIIEMIEESLFYQIDAPFASNDELIAPL